MLLLVIIFLVPTSECGRHALEPFISGGKFSDIVDYPHALFLSMSYKLKWVCGASVLNQRMILTAAHCVYACVGFDKSTYDAPADDHRLLDGCRIDAYAGSTDRKVVQVLRHVSKIICHEHYDDLFVENDVALGLISENFPLGEGYNIKRVILKNTFPSNFNYFRVAGWGITDDITRQISLKLKSIGQRLLTREVCETGTLIHPGTMCASSPANEGGPNSGDSGSAVVTRSHQQIGLVSFKASPNKTSQEPYNEPLQSARNISGGQDIDSSPKLCNYMYYMNVSYYYKWILKNSVALYCND